MIITRGRPVAKATQLCQPRAIHGSVQSCKPIIIYILFLVANITSIIMLNNCSSNDKNNNDDNNNSSSINI